MEIRYFNLSTSLLFLILALILFVRRSPNKRSNSFLGVIFLIIASYSEVIDFHFHSVHTNNVSHLSYYLPLDALLLMLISPCMYFYVLQFLNQSAKLIRWSTLVHVIPLLPCMLFNVLFYCRPVDVRVNWLIQDFYSGSTEMTIINAIVYLQIIFYLISSYQAVRIQKKESIYVEKNGYRTNITWVRLFLLVNIIVIFLSLPICFMINNERTSILIGHIVLNIDFICLFILTALPIGIMNTEKMEDKRISYQMNDEQAVSHWKTLTAYMVASKPYLDEDCSLSSLAAATNMSEHQLSTLLHAHGGVSFTDFINQYRLNEALIYLQDNSKSRKTIETIAADCGFGSRSSFYRAFFKVYAITPTAYRKDFDANPDA